MYYRLTSARAGAIACILALTAALAPARTASQGAPKGDSGRDVTILVTANPHGERERANVSQLTPRDFAVYEDGQKQEIVSVVTAEHAPPVVEILIEDDLVGGVANELRGLAGVIRRLPEGSHVMTGYLTAGSLRVTRDFTTDRNRAAKSLRIPTSSASSSPSFLYSEVVDGIKRFDSQPAGRRILLLISNGLDLGRGLSDASPSLAVDLDRAIGEAQRRGVAVFTFYAPSVGQSGSGGRAVDYGQGSLNRLADETGGVAFFSGTGFVTFDPFFRELEGMLGQQWLVTYRSASTAPGFRKVKVTTEFDVTLRYPQGYRAR